MLLSCNYMVDLNYDLTIWQLRGVNKSYISWMCEWGHYILLSRRFNNQALHPATTLQ